MADEENNDSRDKQEYTELNENEQKKERVGGSFRQG